MPESTQPHTPVQQSAWLQVGVVHTVLAFFAVYPLGQAKLVLPHVIAVQWKPRGTDKTSIGLRRRGRKGEAEGRRQDAFPIWTPQSHRHPELVNLSMWKKNIEYFEALFSESFELGGKTSFFLKATGPLGLLPVHRGFSTNV